MPFLLAWLLFLFRGFISTAIEVALTPLGVPSPPIPQRYLDWMPLLLLAGLVVTLSVRPSQTVSFLLGLLFFPFVLLFRAILGLLILIYSLTKSALRLPSHALSVVTSPRFNLVLLTLLVFSAAAILRSWYLPLFPGFVAVVLAGIVTLHIHAVVFVFRPGLFHRSAANLALEHSRLERGKIHSPGATTPEPRPIIQIRSFKMWLPEPERASTLESLRLLNEGALKYFRRIREQPIPLKLFTLGLVVYFVVLTLLFAITFWGLEVRFPGSFGGRAGIGFFDLLIFSITNMITATYGDVLPSAPWAKVLAVLQLLSALTIGVVLLLVFTTLSKERYKQELNEITNDFEKELEELASLRRKVGSPALPPQAADEVIGKEHRPTA